MTEILYLGLSKSAFGELGKQGVFPEGVKYYLKVLKVGVQVRTIDKYVIKENKDKVSQVRFKN